MVFIAQLVERLRSSRDTSAGSSPVEHPLASRRMLVIGYHWFNPSRGL